MRYMVRRCFRLLVAIPVALCLAPLPDALAANGLDYTYVEVGYAIDSTAEVYGQAYDSDSSLRAIASYLVNRHLFVSAQYYDSDDYDFESLDDYGVDYRVSGYSLGLGYRSRLGGERAMPTDWFVELSYEHIATHSNVHEVDYTADHDGAGLKFGIRTAVTERVELSFEACEQSYGSDLLTRHGPVNGLSFELGAVVKLGDRVRLTAAYKTGELDYALLANYPKRWDIEVDRDEVIVGVRWSFH